LADEEQDPIPDPLTNGPKEEGESNLQFALRIHAPYIEFYKEKRLKELRAQEKAQKIRERVAERHGEQGLKPKLDTEKIKRWMRDEGYTNKTLAVALERSERVVSSILNDGTSHGPPVITKLAKLMKEKNVTNLYMDE
jgi:hypothetical protein